MIRTPTQQPPAAALFALALSACAGTLPSYNLTVRDLAASSQPHHPPNGVAVAAEPITGATWRAHPEIVAHAGATLRFAFGVERKTQSLRCPTGTWECLKKNEDALRLYNAQAGATGLCAPVW